MTDDPTELYTLVLKLGDDETVTRQQAMNALAQHPLTSNLIDLLLAALYNPMPRLRINAVQMLSRSEDFRVVPPLLDLLAYDPDWQVRLHVALALAKLKDKSAIEPLQTSLHSDTDWQVRRAAAEALRSFTSDSVVRALIDALDDPVEAVAIYAAESLHEKSKQEIATTILDDLLDSATPSRKPTVVHKLCRLENPKSARRLVDLLHDRDVQIRIQAARFLGAMNWKLAKIDQWKAIEALTDVLETDENDDVRVEAVFAVGNFRSKQARTALILALDDRSSIVGEIARGWLREFGYDPDIFGMACTSCGRTQAEVDIAFKPCLQCGKIICGEHWMMHSLGGPFCCTDCQADYLKEVTTD